MVAREFSNDVGMRRSPVPALGYDRAETAPKTTVCTDAWQQWSEFYRNAWAACILKASLPQHMLEKCADAIDAGAFIGIQRKLPLTLKYEFPVLYDTVIEDHEGRD